MPDFLTLPTFASAKEIHVVVETPRFARAKFKYEPNLGVFMLSRPLTLGLSYPFDWGFVPSTVAPDGDPIDALVLNNVTTAPGMVLKCRPIGILDVAQTEHRKTIRNDRLMVVPGDAAAYDAPSDLSDLPQSGRHQAEEFFSAAVAGTAKKLKFLGWRGPRAAWASIRRTQKAFADIQRQA
jgi:inorganic pyrophosphatase